MFEGSDLDAAYGSSMMSHGMTPVQNLPMMGNPPPAPMVQSGEKPRTLRSQPTVETFAPTQQQANAGAGSGQQGGGFIEAESFWDRLAKKRSEVFKMVLLAFIVVFALAVDDMSRYYMTSYLGNGFFTFYQELLVRASYPILVVLALWIIKAW